MVDADFDIIHHTNYTAHSVLVLFATSEGILTASQNLPHHHGSHFSGLTKLPDFSSIFFPFVQCFFNILLFFLELKTLSIFANNMHFT